MRALISLIILIFSFTSFAYGENYGVAGIPDPVPASTLIVPFFQVGISQAEHSDDTLLMVRNVISGNSTKIHYEVWDIDGRPVGIRGNFDDHCAVSMREVIEAQADENAKQMLTQGDFYRGFVTFDAVEEATNATPLDDDYPLRAFNGLEGRIYYVRLEEGSSNGINMIHIEDIGSNASSFLRGFYKNDDTREEIDSEARWCAHQMSIGKLCGQRDNIMRIHSRVYMNSHFNGSSKIIIFTWSPGYSFGPSRYCDTHSCNSVYVYQHYKEDSTELVDTKDIRLDHVVNVIDVTNENNGMVSIRDIPSAIANFQVYGFSFNSANPPENAGYRASWDAILESLIF